MSVKIEADAVIDLPYALDFCASGPEVEPYSFSLLGYQVTLCFPPSLGETTDGKAIFGDWAWWTGKRLYLKLTTDTAEPVDTVSLREAALECGDEVLRRFINAVRWRFDRCDVYPVRIDPKRLELYAVTSDGKREALPEPVSDFFYQKMPNTPPLQTSVCASTRDLIIRDIVDANEPPLSVKLDQDADALDEQGEYLRADIIRGLARQQLD